MQTRLKVTQTTYVEGTVNEKDLVDAFEQYIREKTGLNNFWVREKDGALMEEIEAYHGSNWDENRGQATDAQKLGYKMVNQLKDIYFERIKK